jgi:hypothetical protein
MLKLSFDLHAEIIEVGVMNFVDNLQGVSSDRSMNTRQCLANI